MGMLSRICSHLMIFLSVDAFMENRRLMQYKAMYPAAKEMKGVDLRGKCVDEKGGTVK